MSEDITKEISPDNLDELKSEFSDLQHMEKHDPANYETQRSLCDKLAPMLSKDPMILLSWISNFNPHEPNHANINSLIGAEQLFRAAQHRYPLDRKPTYPSLVDLIRDFPKLTAIETKTPLRLRALHRTAIRLGPTLMDHPTMIGHWISLAHNMRLGISTIKMLLTMDSQQYKTERAQEEVT